HRLVEGALYGIWASRSGATGVRVRPDGDDLVLDGVLRFASGAGVIDRSLVPVWTTDEHHLLVDLDVSALPVDAAGWQSGAMTVSRTHTVTLVDVRAPARAVVGPVDFYLDRPAFLPGGVGVAAVWAGGLARLVDTVLGWLRRSTPVMDVRLGRLRTHLVLATAAARQAGLRLDGLLTPDGSLREPGGADLLAPVCTEARAAVAQTVRLALEDARAVAGAAGLAFDAALTHAVDDLGLYTAQQPADADAETLGRTWRAP
ncbi:MAG: hypothetical protein JWP61_1828, partial [Friedmanniella sp.]|nr:hypothetical protein [Friedmanniella sp.]